MRAGWETGSIKTDEERIEAVDFASGIGLDTLILSRPTKAMVSHTHDKGMQIIASISPFADDAFKSKYPHAVQKVRPYEENIVSAIDGQPWVGIHGKSYMWQTYLLPRRPMCYTHRESMTEFKRRIDTALDVADGVALDGFGYSNYYACFCDRCCDIRAQAASPEFSETEVLGQTSAQTLVDVHRDLHDYAKSIKPDAIVTNHIWPKFLPDEYVGYRYKLDYCTQTISWFYPPEWRLERVEFEATENKRLENPDNNRFVPFIGIVDMDGLVRKPERLATEIEIALRHGEGSLVLSRLWTLQTHPELADAARKALKSR